MPKPKLSEVVDPLTDAWIEAEDGTGIYPNSEFRISFFKNLEDKLVGRGYQCDFEGCTRHKNA